ncbi:MAG: hypothetical protein PHC51_06090 [bacterium]|nr:hypothetical protein [bacterium]
MSPFFIGGVLGHEDQRTTLKFYMMQSDQVLLGAVETLASVLKQAMPEEESRQAA